MNVKIEKVIQFDAPGIGARIKDARERDPRSVEELAKAAGMTRANWYRIEREENDSLPEATLIKIEEVLGVNLRDGVQVPDNQAAPTSLSRHDRTEQNLELTTQVVNEVAKQQQLTSQQLAELREQVESNTRQIAENTSGIAAVRMLLEDFFRWWQKRGE